MPACTSSFIPDLDGHGRLDEDELVELWHVLSTVPDPRDPRGVRHAFATILTLAIGAVLAGCRSVAAITAWTVDLAPWTAYRLGVRRRPPSLSTFSRTLIGVDPDVLDAVLGAWLAARTSAPAGMRALAVDGKTARGARRPDGTRVHLVACLDHATGTVLGQVEVTCKGSEITAFAAVLDRLDLHGCVVTADALHTQRAHAHYLHRHGGHYVLTVKGNQPALRKQCAALPWSQVKPRHVEHAAGHGRRERRTIQVITAVHPALPFPHARQVARIVRHRRHGPTGRERMQVEFIITDLTPEQADPAQLAALVRGHWGIENRLHWVRDVTYAEDHCALRTGPINREHHKTVDFECALVTRGFFEVAPTGVDPVTSRFSVSPRPSRHCIYVPDRLLTWCSVECSQLLAVGFRAGNGPDMAQVRGLNALPGRHRRAVGSRRRVTGAVLCTQSDTRGGSAMSVTVGVREFRQDLAGFIDQAEPVTVTRHGHTVGLFIPVHRNREAGITAYAEAAKKASALLAQLGVTEDEVVAEFEALRQAEREAGQEA